MPGTTSADRVLDAALELFAAQGPDATPVPAIAERAGVAVGTIYRSFEGKAELVNALFRRWKAELRDRLLAPRPEGLTPREEFAEWWGRLGDFAVEHPTALVFLELHRHGPELDDASRAIAAEVDVAAAAFVARAQAAGAMRAGDPADLVALAFGAFVGLAKARLDAGRPLDATLAADSEDAVWHLLAPPGSG